MSVVDRPTRYQHWRQSSIRQRVERMDETLEPLFPTGLESKRRRPLTAVLYLFAFVGITVVLLLRQSGVGATNTIWAEDGQRFYKDALSHSGASNLVRIYNGYVQLLPRLVFEAVRLVPLQDVAFTTAVTGAALVAGLALIVFRSSAAFIRSPLLRGLLVASMTLLPVAPGELLDNVVNVPWWLIFASFWVLFWRPCSWSGRVVAGVVCLLAAASDPIVALLLPIAVLRALVSRRPSENTATIGLLAGLFFQIAVAASSNVSSSYQLGGSGRDFLKAFGVRVGLGPVTGVRITDNLWSVQPQLASILGVGVFGLLIGVAAAQHGRQLRLFVLVVLAESVTLFIVPVFLRGAAPTLAAKPVWFSSRWQVAPELVVLSAVLVATNFYVRRHRRGLWLIVVVALALAPAWILDFRLSNPRTDGPAWGHQVALARQECETGHPKQVTLATSPPGWSVALPCRFVETH